MFAYRLSVIGSIAPPGTAWDAEGLRGNVANENKLMVLAHGQARKWQLSDGFAQEANGGSSGFRLSAFGFRLPASGFRLPASNFERSPLVEVASRLTLRAARCALRAEARMPKPASTLHSRLLGPTVAPANRLPRWCRDRDAVPGPELLRLPTLHSHAPA